MISSYNALPSSLTPLASVPNSALKADASDRAINDTSAQIKPPPSGASTDHGQGADARKNGLAPGASRAADFGPREDAQTKISADGDSAHQVDVASERAELIAQQAADAQVKKDQDARASELKQTLFEDPMAQDPADQAAEDASDKALRQSAAIAQQAQEGYGAGVKAMAPYEGPEMSMAA